MPDRPHVLLVLANLMDADGNLNAETAARVDLAQKLFAEGADYVFFIGWPYRPDSDLAIADAMAAHRPSLPQDRVLVNRQSRDSVGDAILSRRDLEARFPDFDLTVVSSDYHLPRLRHIFARVYGPERDIRFAGAEAPPDPDRPVREAASIRAFDKSFAGVPTGDLAAFESRLLADHPFYNGEVHPALMLDPRA